MADKLMYIPKDTTQNYIIQIVVKTFGHSTFLANQSKSN